MATAKKKAHAMRPGPPVKEKKAAKKVAPPKATPRVSDGKKKHRVGFATNPNTGRTVMMNVTAEGGVFPRQQARFGFTTVDRWVEVRAASHAKAMAAVTAGEGEWFGADKRKKLEGLGESRKSVSTPVVMDDSEVRVIFSALFSKGWKSKAIRIGGTAMDVITDPDGEEFVLARANERADLIIDHTEDHPEVGRVRWKAYATSGAAKKVKKEKKQIARAKDTAKVKRAAKKTKKAKAEKA